jgi:hypothetical protein
MLAAMPRSLTILLLAMVCLARPAAATWSIILIDTRTGEIAVASATCVAGLDLTIYVPVILLGKGAACAQSSIDASGANRVLIRDQLALGTSPAQILAMLAAADGSHQTRQYGIVDVRGRAVGFTGTSTGTFASDRVGRAGDIVYAIQGNVLTGGTVLAAAEIALYATQGDLADKLMAMMEAARLQGGDGRCSCAELDPTGCGAPPPSFTKSAHIGFMIVARPGDTDGTCNAQFGCARGSYHLRLNVPNRAETSPDPVLTLRANFDAWRVTQRGHADQMRSTLSFDPNSLPFDGTSVARATLVLRDREGTRIPHGGANVAVTPHPTSSTNVSIGAVTDNGDGSYSFDVRAGTNYGQAIFAVDVNDGLGVRRLSPPPVLGISLNRLWADRSTLSAATGGRVQFGIQPQSSLTANRWWILLGSMSGTTPGVRIPPFVLLPLNPDPFFEATAVAAFTGAVPGLMGQTSALGLAGTSLTFPPGVWSIPVGTDVSFAYTLFDPVTLASNPITLRILP